MTTIRFSSTGSATAAGTVALPLGGAPTQGDLVVVWLGVSNQVTTHQPGYGSPATQWSEAGSIRSRLTNGTLTCWHHTWNASDSGSSVNFSISPAPSLGVGDPDLSTADVVWVTATLTGPVGRSEYSVQDEYDGHLAAPSAPLKAAHSSSFTAALVQGGTTFTDSDPAATLVATVSDATQGLSVYQAAAPAAGYAPTMTADAGLDPVTHTLAVNDAPSWLYRPPVIYEGQPSDNMLIYRYTHQRSYTVLNNGGTYTAVRYPTVDDLNNATAWYTPNAPVTDAVRTAILAAGVGGDFISA